MKNTNHIIAEVGLFYAKTDYPDHQPFGPEIARLLAIQHAEIERVRHFPSNFKERLARISLGGSPTPVKQPVGTPGFPGIGLEDLCIDHLDEEASEIARHNLPTVAESESSGWKLVGQCPACADEPYDEEPEPDPIDHPVQERTVGEDEAWDHRYDPTWILPGSTCSNEGEPSAPDEEDDDYDDYAVVGIEPGGQRIWG